MARPRREGITYKDSKPFVYKACALCGKVRLVREDSAAERCKDCQPKGEQSHNWKGGRQKDPAGYIWIKLDNSSPFAFMGSWRNKGTTLYIQEHRLVMAQHLGRCLTKDEIVHHINGIRKDNHIENLKLATRKNHRLSYDAAYQEGFYAGLKARDKSLGQQIKLLQWQIKDLKESLAEATKWRYGL